MNKYSKCLILCCLSFLFSQFVFSQKWDSLGQRTNRLYTQGSEILYADSNYLYMAGRFNEVAGKHLQGIARWDGVKWDSLGAGIDAVGYYDTMPGVYPNNTESIISYHNKLYVGGGFSSLGNVNAYSIGIWDGASWDSLPVQPCKSNYITGGVGLTVINDKLYMGGYFDTIAGFPCIGIACWNDTNWSSLNFPQLTNFSYVSAICEYKGSIYAAGLFSDSLNDTISNILRWDGRSWHSVGGGIKGNFVSIFSMIVYNGELYLGGLFTQSEGNVSNYIQRWDGTSWKDAGGGVNGISNSNGEVENLMVYHNKLYAMGAFSIAGSVYANYIADWDDTEWCSLGSTFDNVVSASCVYKDSLYIGGAFNTIDGDSIIHVAEWVDGNYTSACGNDTTAGVGEVIAKNEEVKVYPNPSNGQFTLVIASEAKQSPNTIEVYNVLGEKVFTETLHSAQGDNTINLSNQPNGVYLYRVIANSGDLVGEGKMVIER